MKAPEYCKKKNHPENMTCTMQRKKAILLPVTAQVELEGIVCGGFEWE